MSLLFCIHLSVFLLSTLQPSAIFLVNYWPCTWFPFILCRNVVNSLSTIMAFHVVLWVAKTTAVLYPPYMPALCKAALQFLPSKAVDDFSSLESGLACNLLWPIESGRCDPVSFQALSSRSHVCSLSWSPNLQGEERHVEKR